MSFNKMLRRTGAVVAPAALVPALGATTPASVAVSAAPTGESAAGSAPASPTSTTTDMTRVKGIRSTGSIAQVTAAVRAGEVTRAAPQDFLKSDRATVYEAKSEQTTHTSITVLIEGAFSVVSNLTVVFDSLGQIVQSGETLISENKFGNFNISDSADGVLVKSNDTDRPYVTNSKLASAPAAAGGVSAQSVGDTVDGVLAVLGASGGTTHLIVGACAGARTTPVVGTAICVACIGEYATVGGASIAAVASCFRRGTA